MATSKTTAENKTEVQEERTLAGFFFSFPLTEILNYGNAQAWLVLKLKRLRIIIIEYNYLLEIRIRGTRSKHPDIFFISEIIN